MSQSPFVVENLTPTSPTGQPQGTYELKATSVSPSRVVGRGPLGPIEETVPTTHWANFLMLDGCVNKVPLRTGSVFSMQAEAKAYEDETVTELVNAGCIPAHECPHGLSAILRGPYVSPPPGVQACGGSGHSMSGPDASGTYGCEHMKQIAAIRKQAVLDRYNAEAELMSKMDDAKIAKLHATLAASVGEAIAKHAAPPDRKQAARATGRGDAE